MPRKTTASPKKATKKKAAPKKAAPVTHSKKEGGGLGVVIVLLVGILIIGAMFIAIQNSKTTELEKEVTMLTGELEGKFAELNDEIASTKEEQEKQKEEVEKLSQKTYSHEEGAFSFEYPKEYSATNFTNHLFDEPIAAIKILDEVNADLFSSEGEDKQGEGIFIYVFENEDSQTLEEWLLTHTEEYGTLFAEDTDFTTEMFGENEFLTYSETEFGTSHFYSLNGEHVLVIRSIQMNENSRIVDVAKAIINTMEF